MTKVVTYNLQVRPDAPADGGEGFKRTWSEAKEEVLTTFQNTSLNIESIFYLENRQDGQKMAKAMGNVLG